MPVHIQAPNGDLVEFPDGTPDDVMAGAMAKEYGGPTAAHNDAPPPPAAPAEDTFHRSTILPLGKDSKTGEISLAVPGAITAIPGIISGAAKGIYDAVTAPGDAYNGNLQVIDPAGNITPEAIKRSTEFASTFGVGVSPGTAAEAVVARAAPVQAVVKPGMDAAAAAGRLGVDLPRAVASDATVVQQGGKILSNLPVIGTPLRKASRNAIDQLGQAADTVQQGYGVGDVAGAGAGLRQDAINYGTVTLKGQSKNAYDAVDALVDPSVKTPLTETQQKAAEIVAKRNNATLGDGQAASIVRDATQPIPSPPPVAPAPNPVGFTAKVADIPPTPPQAPPKPNPGLNYFGVKDLRTSIGEMIDDPTVRPAGTSQNELRAIYGSLSTDLGNAAENAGGAAARKAWEDANALHAANSAERENLDRIIAPKSDEGLFAKIHAMAGTNSSADLSQLAQARKAVTPDTWNDVAGGVIAKMGRDADGNFSPDRFITAYGKLSPNGKNLLFRSTGKDDLANSLEDIATVSRKFKELNQYANPSGTGQTLSGFGMLQGLVSAPTTTISTVIGGRMLSSLLARPVSAKAIAAYSKAYQGAATAPSAATISALANTSRALAAIVGNASGDKSLAQSLVPQLSAVKRVPAEQGNENESSAEDKNSGEQGQL